MDPLEVVGRRRGEWQFGEDKGSDSDGMHDELSKARKWVRVTGAGEDPVEECAISGRICTSRSRGGERSIVNEMEMRPFNRSCGSSRCTTERNGRADHNYTKFQESDWSKLPQKVSLKQQFRRMRRFGDQC